MCGIAGIISKQLEKTFDTEIVEMTNVVAHRGPDGFGYYEHDNVYFGHRRLSIIDLSEDGKQPMSYLDRYTITFNGEIYNYIEIKEELIKDNYIFHSASDTEVILASYDKWGENCVLKFNGMWSFAIHDTIKNIIFCSRDRFGVKPFHYTNNAKFFAFGSEIKQLLTLVDAKANKKAIVRYLVNNMTNNDENTFFEDIYSLKGGHNLIYKLLEYTIEIKRYYTIQINEANKNLSEEDSVKLFRKELDRSIQYRLRSDVTVGTCLSGGLDSSSIAALASKKYSKQASERFKAVTAYTNEVENDESHYAKIVTEALGLDQMLVNPSTEYFLENIKELIYTQEEPFVDTSVMMQYSVMETAKKHGIIVLLDGQGADEVLFGYVRYIAAYLKQLSFLGKIKTIFQIKENYGVSISTILKNYYYFSFTKLRKYIQLSRLPKLSETFKKEIDFSFIDLYSKANSNIEELQILDLTMTQVPQLLRFEDRNSMRHSIETRLPFLDWQLVETALSLNNSYKIKNGWSKFVLRSAIDKDLPSEIVWRKKKMNFNAPHAWLKEKSIFYSKINESKIINECFTSDFDISTVKNNQLFWRLYNIALWEEIFKVII